MCDLTIGFWRGALGLPIVGFEAAIIKEGYLPSTVYRARLDLADAPARAVILKCVRPPWGDDIHRGERECRVYTELVANLPIPQAPRYLAKLGDEHTHTRIVMQDLSNECVFYPETHAWTWAEAQAILRALARLHSGGEGLGVRERPYLMERLSNRWAPTRMREMYADLEHTEWLKARMARAAGSVERVLDELPQLEKIANKEPLTLVHYDIYPPNIAFSREREPMDAVLIDWAAATADIGEIDLAFLFQQPYKSARLLDWRTALKYYWDERKQLTGEAYDWQERCAVFRYARIQTIFTTLLAIHRAWEKCEREGLRLAPDSPDFYMRFFDATLNDVLDILQELGEHTEYDH